MSTTPIWNPNAVRHELGGARKWQIYLSKVAIGYVLAFALWLISFANLEVMIIGAACVFITSKVCWYLDTGDTIGWDAPPDWVTDGILHFGWLWALAVGRGARLVPAIVVVLFLGCYPWSCE